MHGGNGSSYPPEAHGPSTLFLRVQPTLAAYPYTNEEGSYGKTRETLAPIRVAAGRIAADREL